MGMTPCPYRALMGTIKEFGCLDKTTIYLNKLVEGNQPEEQNPAHVMLAPTVGNRMVSRFPAEHRLNKHIVGHLHHCHRDRNPPRTHQ
jgi:hypothetical protein